MKYYQNAAAWPLNLLFAMNGRDTLEDCHVASDWRGMLEYMIMEMLPDDEEQAVRSRYQYGMTYRQIGEHLNTTPGHVHQLLRRAFHRLRHPSRYRYLCYGVTKMHEGQWERVREDQFNEGYWIGFRHGALGEMAPSLENPYIEHDDPSKMPILAAPISYLKLCNRMNGALARAGMRTIGEVVTKTRRELLNLRNVGKGSVDELEEKLAQYHLVLRYK